MTDGCHPDGNIHPFQQATTVKSIRPDTYQAVR